MSDPLAPELTQTRSFLDSLIENLPLMIFVKDAKELKFIRFNKAGESLLGYSRSELIGKNDFDFFPAAQAEAFITKDREVLMGKSIVDIPQEAIDTKKNGRRILHTKKIPLFNEAGEPEYLLGISEDITEQIEHEKVHLRMIQEEIRHKEKERFAERSTFFAKAGLELASSLDYHESLMRLVRLIVPSVCDGCNITVRKDDGTLEEVVTNTIYPQSKQRIMIHETINRWIASIGSTTPLNAEISNNILLAPITYRGQLLGSIAFFNVSNKPPFNDEIQVLANELGGRAGIAIENALLYDKAQKAIELRNEFLSIASHELKTPITSLKLQMQMTKRQIDREPEKNLSRATLDKAFTRSISQIDRLVALVDNLLDVSRIEAGKIDLNFTKVNVSTLVNDVIERYSSTLALANCEVRTSIEKDIFIIADLDRLEQVLVNLLSNAIKYAPGKPLEVKVHQGPHSVLIAFKDHGPGIQIDEQKHIFERFGRTLASRNISGMGLGLYISQQIIQSHGGSLVLESELGKGSTFTITFPQE